MKLGLSGSLTRATIQSPLTPLFLLAAVILGLLATFTIAREEEPQISVPMVDIRVQVPGLAAPDAVELVAKPLETIVRSIDGVEHTYTQVEDNGVLVTARFYVGTDPDAAAVRINEKLHANWDRIPIGVPDPLVSVRTINDVPIVVLTLSPHAGQAGRWNEASLREMAERLRTEVAKVDDVGLTFITGGAPEEIRVAPDPALLALRGVPLSSLADAVSQANRAFPAGNARESGRELAVTAGRTLSTATDVGMLEVSSAKGAPVYVRDVATVTQQPQETQNRVERWAKTDGSWSAAPAVSISVAKRAGSNAVTVAKAVIDRVDNLKGGLIPPGLDVAVTRDYGASANDKANELLFHLGLATISIVLLICFTIGWREAGVTAIVIPTTIMLTLFASKLMGYTINRVSLFALIFSIGILVDDAIVIIENIARHWSMPDGRTRIEATIDAVAEVGNPTVIATLTVVAALLPMLFVSGLMGPYMAPIPVNASAAMIFSFFVAVVIAPWLMVRFARKALQRSHEAEGGGRLGQLYARIARPLIASKRRASIFLGAVGIATLIACSMFYFEFVTVKLLPFDNKSEVQVVIDLPEGAALEDTARTAEQVASIARTLPEVTAMELYSGTAAPFNFNGLVRHYYLRDKPEQGDVMITLLPKNVRTRASHDIAVVLREKLKTLKLRPGSSIKVVETPPGPPVLATLLGEVYGPDAETRRNTAAELERLFRSVRYVVDVDTSYRQQRPQLLLVPDRAKLDYYGLSEGEMYDSIGMLMRPKTVGYAPRGGGHTPLPITIELPQAARRWDASLASTPIAVARGAGAGRLVELGEVVNASRALGSYYIFRRDGRAADMVTADMAGEFEAPIYGMLAVDRAIEADDWVGKGLVKPVVKLHGQPTDESKPTLLWDGEWEITWVTFRDMGAAFGVALLGIYFLVVGQFRSFRLPLVILTPIPLTLVGIVLGHMLFRAPFTATSMIGFIALAGIIVRNSILLVDFIRHAQNSSRPLRDVLIEAGSIRFKPILLTALAAMIGAAVILSDPIFQGLAISLLFGLASSTLLTVLVIPAIYIVLRDDGRLTSAGEPT